MNSTNDTPFMKVWILAVRPKTLPAAVSPVLVGTAAAIADNRFVLIPALAALIGALLLQVAVNLANDYFDFKKGIDTPDRLGPVRVTQSGLISPSGVKAGIFVTLGFAAVCGVYLIYVAGLPILLIGLASIIAALAYSGGPFPIASHGLGDLFVFIFFGLVAVCGTFYVQALKLNCLVVLIAVPIGFLITAILVVNNLRDISTDRDAGKNTLAVRLGEKGTRIEYIVLLTASYLIPIFLSVTGNLSPWVLLILLSLPITFSLIRYICTESGRPLNDALAGTAKLAFIFSLLISIGLIMNVIFGLLRSCRL